MNIVIISAGQRPELLYQTLSSARNNAEHWNDHSLTIVYDGISPMIIPQESATPHSTLIHNIRAQGASAARNIGASSIPKYRRQKYVLFLDDDVWMAPRWDEALIEMADALPRHLYSLYGHPFNHEEDCGNSIAKFPLLISSVCVFMPWTAWDEIGFWQEPGGPGASEDFEYCSRAKRLGYRFAVSKPHRLIHCGITSSSGTAIIGQDQLMHQNTTLSRHYRVDGQIKYE